MKIIGLTGGIATGKSTVANWFFEDGIPVVDADKVYKDLCKRGGVLYNEITRAFGIGILNDAESIDWKKLGAIVFADESKRLRLNEIAHPAVKTEMLKQAKAYAEVGETLLVFAVPLLFETDFHKLCDRTVLVYAPLAVQLERLIARDRLTRHQALQRIGAQLPLKQKLHFADVVIDNSGDLNETRRRYEAVLNDVRRTICQ